MKHTLDFRMPFENVCESIFKANKIYDLELKTAGFVLVTLFFC